MVSSSESTDDSEIEVVFIKEEREALQTDTTLGKREMGVHMNLQAGKVLPEPMRSKQYRAKKDKPSTSREATVLNNQQEKSSDEEAKEHGVEYNVIAHLKQIPALLSVYEALVLLLELREALVKALQKPEHYQAAMAKHRLFDNLLYANQITFF